MARFLGLRGSGLASAISLTCGLCFLCFGYAQGVMGGLLTIPIFLARYPQLDTINNASFHNAWVVGITVGAWNLGCIVSAMLTIFIGDLLGRRRTLILGLTLWVVGETIQSSSYTFAQLVVGRAIAGFGNGFTTSTAPAYQAECVKSHRKGTVLMISAGAFVSAGYALSYWLTFGFGFLTGSSAAWRVPIAFQIVFALPAIAMLFVLPESPRWLILTGREQEALAVLAALNNGAADDFQTKDEFLQIKDAILIMASGSKAGLFSNEERRGFHRVVLAYFVQIFQQGTGINLILQYLSWIFLTRLSYTGWVARLLAGCAATIYFLASFIVVVGIDRFWGRRSLMLFGAAGMSGCMVIISILQYLWWEHNINAGRIASTVLVIGFTVFFAIGWQGMAWLYQVEIVPLRIRGPANGLSTSANWLLNFVVVFITPIAFQNISWRTWIIFAVTNFAILPVVYFLYPETAFRSLEEVDVIFQLANDEPGNPWTNVVRISKSEPLWFGKRGEKREKFSYANSSWHKRLLHSRGSSSSGNGSSNEKRSYGTTTTDGNTTNTGRNDSDPETFVMPYDQESPIDPMLACPSTLSSRTTVATTICSGRKPNKLRKRNSSGSVRPMDSSSENRSQPVVATGSHHQRTRSNSEESIHSVQPDWWTEDLAPAPLSARSRTSSLNRQSRPTTSDQHRQALFQEQPRAHRSSSPPSMNAFVDQDPFPQAFEVSDGRDSNSYHACSVDHRDDSVSITSYPGIVGGRLGRASSGRTTYPPNGIYEITDGRVQSDSRPVDGRLNARGSGRGY
ncbi:hypothetical protein ACN47E_007405 [Coniothyrium glycines]